MSSNRQFSSLSKVYPNAVHVKGVVFADVSLMFQPYLLNSFE